MCHLVPSGLLFTLGRGRKQSLCSKQLFSMSSSSKASRKARRVAEKVKLVCGIDVLEPKGGDKSRHLLICNFGLTTGATHEALAELLLPFGELQRITLLPLKSYSFVSYLAAEHAAAAYESVHGKLGLYDSDGPPIYLAFVDRVPETSEDKFDRQIPAGLTVVENFVSEAEERSILDSLALEDESSVGHRLKHRQVFHYGFDFVYGSNSIDPENPNGRAFPAAWTPMLQRAVDAGHLSAPLPDQCTVNVYEPGQGIPPHVDSHDCCDGAIASLSLGSDVVMNFTRHPDAAVSVVLPRRSLMVMREEARYVYSHGIASRSSDVVPATGDGGLTLRRRGRRISLTFRKTMRGRCQCRFPAHCDSRKPDKIEEMDSSLARALEETHVHLVYEEIADHFSETRHRPWPRVTEFLSSLPEGGVLIDVGCGNGKYLGRHEKQLQIGCEYSQGLVSICRQRGFNGVRGDCLNLPFRSDCADGIICIAVIHHLCTEKRRLQAIEEIIRVLRPGGRCLIYAWAKDQHRNEQPSTYLKKKEVAADAIAPQKAFPASALLPVHTNRTNFQHADVLVPWKKKNSETFHRFYHVFDENELEGIVGCVDNVFLEESYYDQGNWCVVLKKRDA